MMHDPKKRAGYLRMRKRRIRHAKKNPKLGGEGVSQFSGLGSKRKAAC